MSTSFNRSIETEILTAGSLESTGGTSLLKKLRKSWKKVGENVGKRLGKGWEKVG